MARDGAPASKSQRDGRALEHRTVDLQSQDSRLVAIIPKNARSEFRVGLSEKHGRVGIDLGFFADRGLRIRDLKTGVHIKPSLIPAVIEALREALAAYERTGGADAGDRS